MPGQGWGADIWSAMAAGCSAVAAFASLVVAWHAKRIHGKSADFGNCIEVAGQLRDAMRRVHDAQEDTAKVRFEFIELLNLLEALALLFNDDKIAASTRKFTGKFLAEGIGWIAVSENLAALMRESMTGDETYKELRRFRESNESEIRLQTHSQ